MKKFSCVDCGKVSSKWIGQCGSCLQWGTVQEEDCNNDLVSKGQPLKTYNLTASGPKILRYQTNISEFDKVLGGGLVIGSATLIGGEPGIGKSTITLQICESIANLGKHCLYISAEESLNQIKLRAERLGIKNEKIKLATSSSVEDIISTLKDNLNAELIIIDSIQTIQTANLDSTPGTVSQVKATANILISYAKQHDIILFIVGHVTKDGNLAGPKLLEHMVDTVLYFENDTQNNLRIIRSIKNRFGAVNELGIFEMLPNGLKEVLNPSNFFLGSRMNATGSSIFAGIEGARPLIIEVQALLAPSNMPTPRRSVVGWELSRLSTLLAVLSVRARINLSNYEVYLAIAGGLKVNDPAIDLAVAAAILSSVTKKTFAKNTIFFGEIGLSGEVRQVNFLEQRIKEAQKLGFDNIISFADNNSQINCIKHVSELLNILNTK